MNRRGKILQGATRRSALRDDREGSPVQFQCRCSQGRVAGLLRALGADEIRDVVREQGAVTVTCEFCHRPYHFDAIDVEALFADAVDSNGPPSIH